MMKVKIKSVLKTMFNDVDCFQDQQIIFRSGNTLCIKQIGKNECQFICLSPHIDHLYAFKPATNRKGVFTAQKIQNNIEIALYSLKGDRKSILLSNQNQFFSDIQTIELLVDEYDNNIVYGAARNKEGACVFLGDMSKLKVLAYGYMPYFQDIKLDSRQNLTLSICCNNGSVNFVKFLRYASGQWEVEEQAYKKLHQGLAFQHQILPCNRMLLVAKACVCIFQDGEVIQTIELEGGEKIREILKIDRGLLIFGEDQRVRVFIQDSDDVTFMSKGVLRLQLEKGDSIHKVFLNHSNEQVIVRTTSNNIYIWKCQHINLQNGHFDFAFVKAESSCSTSHEGSISISTGRRYCVLAGTRNVTLWSVEKNEFVLSSEFISNLQAQKKKSILCSAINPDGNSFMVAFDDKIRIYRILLTKFKSYAEFPIKKCQQIIYSHGGQLSACRFGKGINSSIAIINNLRLVEVGTLKIQAEAIQYVWNQLDDQILVATEQNTVQIYRVADNARIHTIKFDSKISYVRIDYKIRKIMVSTENRISIIDNGAVMDEIKPPFEDFHYVYPLYGIYFLTTKNGMLYWSYSYRFQQYHSYSLFHKQPFNLICRNSYMIAYSSFENIMILHIQRPNHFPSKEASTDDIVMIERDQITGLFEKVKILQNNFDILTGNTQNKLEQQRSNYEAAIIKFKEQFSRQVKFVNNNFTDVSTAKLKQEKQTQKVFEQLETGQVRYVNDIQQMYERKCLMLQQNYLNLQQKKLSQKIKYEGIIADIETRFHQEVQQIRQNYQKRYQQECQRAQKQASKILQYKQKMQYKLLDLEQENDFTILEVQQAKDNQILYLAVNNQRLQAELRDIRGTLKTLQQENQTLNFYKDQEKMRFNKITKKNQENTNLIMMLEGELKLKNQMIQQKNQLITQINHQIAELEKAKYVLGYRTSEVRKELQPKENLVERLKGQLLKVDEYFKQQKSKNFELATKIQKFMKINEVLKKQNAQVKIALKLKQRVHEQLCSELFTIVTTIDPKEWNEPILKLYKNFIKENKVKFRQSKKKGDASQQLNRHLMHVQHSLQQVATGNDKILRGKEKDITRRMKQNSQLLYEINMMKKKQIEYANLNNDLQFNNERLQKQLNQFYKSSKKNSTRTNTANTGITRRVVASRDALYSRQKSMFIDSNDVVKEKDFKQMVKQRSRIASAHKALMFKDDKRQKSAKFFDLAKQLQSARNTIKMQDQMISQLNNRIFGDQESVPN